MTDASTTSIPLSLQIAGKTVFEGAIFPHELQAIMKKIVQSSIIPERSFPLTPDQALQLLRSVDPKTAEFLKALAANTGELTFADMKRIFGIETWPDYSSRFGKGLTRALRHLTKNSAATLVSRDEGEWQSDNDPEGLVYVDGQALAALQSAFGIGTVAG